MHIPRIVKIIFCLLILSGTAFVWRTQQGTSSVVYAANGDQCLVDINLNQQPPANTTMYATVRGISASGPGGLWINVYYQVDGGPLQNADPYLKDKGKGNVEWDDMPVYTGGAGPHEVVFSEDSGGTPCSVANNGNQPYQSFNVIPGTPNNLSPNVTNVPGGTPINLSWDGTPPTTNSYDVVIWDTTKNGGNSTCSLSGNYCTTVAGTSLSYTFQKGNAYNWVVYADAGGVKSAASATATINAYGDSPGNLSPADGTVMNPGDFVAVSWENMSTEGATGYLLRIWDKTANPTTIWGGACPAPQPGNICVTLAGAGATSYPYTFLAGHTYEWWVQTLYFGNVASQPPSVANVSVKAITTGYECNKVPDGGGNTIGYYCSSVRNCTLGLDPNCYVYLDNPSNLGNSCDANCRPSCSKNSVGNYSWGQFSRLQIDGSVVAQGTQFSRDLINGDNRCTAAEQVVYDPKYMSNQAVIDLLGQYLQNYHELGF